MRSSSSSTATVYLSLLLCMTQGTYTTTTPNDHQILAEDPINVISNLVLTPEDTFISATWTVENEASDYPDRPQKYEMSYARDGETKTCISYGAYDTNSQNCNPRPNLSPCTEYTVTPQDSNGVTNGVPASDTACTTGCEDEDVVINLTLTPDVDIIHASWGLENPSGNVLLYNVIWVPLSPSSQGTACTVNSSSTDTSSCTPSGQLSPCEEYSVTVHPMGYDMGIIGVAATAEDYTLADVPPEVTGVIATDIIARSLTLTWTAPITACTVTYKVSYTGTADWGDNPVQSDNATSDDVSVVLEDLQPYSNYNLCVTATTDAGDSDQTCITKKTDEDTPSAPLNLTSSEVTDSSLTVSWEPPEELNGWLRSYTITWEEGDDSDTIDVDNDTLTYKIDGLRAETNYTIIVKAVTVDESEPATTSFSTLPSSSSSPVGAIVGAVVGVLLVAALLTLTYIKRDSLLTLAYIKRDWIRDRITKHVQNDKPVMR